MNGKHTLKGDPDYPIEQVLSIKPWWGCPIKRGKAPVDADGQPTGFPPQVLVGMEDFGNSANEYPYCESTELMIRRVIAWTGTPIPDGMVPSVVINSDMSALCYGFQVTWEPEGVTP